jgi:hypothetical protein
MFLPTITPVSTASIVNGQPNDATEVKNGFDNLNGYLTGIDDQRALSVSTSNSSLVANRDIYNPVSTAGGAVTKTLPSGVDHFTQPICIKKISNDLNVLTIACVGSDVIESPFVALTTPTATSITLVLPNEEIWLYPTLVSGVYQWRVVSYNGNVKPVYARAFRNATQSIPNTGFNKIQFNAETSDVYNLFDSTTNFRFTCPVTGVYEISASLAIAPGTSSDCVASIYKNGTEIARGSRNTLAGAMNSVVFSLYEEVTATTDYFEIFIFNSGATRTVEAGAGATYGVFNLKHR